MEQLLFLGLGKEIVVALCLSLLLFSFDPYSLLFKSSFSLDKVSPTVVVNLPLSSLELILLLDLLLSWGIIPNGYFVAMTCALIFLLFPQTIFQHCFGSDGFGTVTDISPSRRKIKYQIYYFGNLSVVELVDGGVEIGYYCYGHV